MNKGVCCCMEEVRGSQEVAVKTAEVLVVPVIILHVTVRVMVNKKIECEIIYYHHE